MEQRQFQRFGDKSVVTFSNGIVQGEGYLSNLSFGGAAVISNVAVMRGSYLTMRIAPTSESSAIQIDLAPVRWAKDGSFGVEVIRLGPDSQLRFKHYIEALEKTSEEAA